MKTKCIITLMLLLVSLALVLPSVTQSWILSTYSGDGNETKYMTNIQSNILGKRIYAVLGNSQLDLEVKSIFAKSQISVTYFAMFNSAIAKEFTVSIINFDILYNANEQKIKEVEDFIFDGNLIFLYGKNLSKFYEKVNWTRFQNELAMFPIDISALKKDNIIKPYVPSNIVALGFLILPKNSVNDSRYPSVQCYLVGDINAGDIVSSILDWIVMINNLNQIITMSSEKEHNQSFKSRSIEPHGWEIHVGVTSWKTTTIKYHGENIGKVEARVDYWYHEDPTRPDIWHYFLVHPWHISKPLSNTVAPYKSISKVDCDTTNKPGQTLYDWGPKNWGGPATSIKFSVSVPSAAASVEYTFDTNSLSWGDLSDPALGIHKVEHNYIHWPTIPYGLTATVEPTSIFMEDSRFSGGTLPLLITHYYWSEFGRQYSGTVSGYVSFTVALYNTHTNA